MLNPFNVLGLGSAGFNPLAALDPASPNFYDDAAALGEALIKIEGKDPHWSESAQGLLVALLMWDKIKNGDAANLENVRALLTEADTWETYTGDDGKQRKRPKGGLSVTAADMIEYGDENRAAMRLPASPRASPNKPTKSPAFDQPPTRKPAGFSPSPCAAICKSRAWIFRSSRKRPTTVYVILPAERMRTH